MMFHAVPESSDKRRMQWVAVESLEFQEQFVEVAQRDREQPLVKAPITLLNTRKEPFSRLDVSFDFLLNRGCPSIGRMPQSQMSKLVMKVHTKSHVVKFDSDPLIAVGLAFRMRERQPVRPVIVGAALMSLQIRDSQSLTHRPC